MRPNGSGATARCPAHDDQRSSLSVSDGDDGRVLVKCHAGCTLDEILSKLALQPRDLFPPREEAAPGKPRIMATYDYVDETRKALPGAPRSSWFVETDGLLINTTGGGALLALDGTLRMANCHAARPAERPDATAPHRE